MAHPAEMTSLMKEACAWAAAMTAKYPRVEVFLIRQPTPDLVMVTLQQPRILTWPKGLGDVSTTVTDGIVRKKVFMFKTERRR